MKPSGRVLFSSVLRRVRCDGDLLYVEDDHGTVLRILLGVVATVSWVVCVASGERLTRVFAGDLLAVALVALVVGLGATVALVRVQHRGLVERLAWADLARGLLTTREGHSVSISAIAPQIVESSTPIDSEQWGDHPRASSWVLQLRLPDRALPLGTSMAPRGRVPPALLSFAHELHRLGFAPPSVLLLDRGS